jgi:hypothetical protein
MDRSGRREAQVHDDDQYQRDDRPEYSELCAAGDHLRQTQLRSLGRVKCHDSPTQKIADQQADNRPEGICAEKHREGRVHDGGEFACSPRTTA